MKKIYLLYTGGTIGMDGHPLKPVSALEFKTLLQTFPSFSASTVIVQDKKNSDYSIGYDLDAFENPVDSSSMRPEDWVHIADRLLMHYEGYDGFVVLHGTDTMAWTSSALSYLLKGLTKPVVVTGSQIPLAQTRNDGFRNLVTSMMVAADQKIPEVCLFFDDALLRGNRAVKVHSSEFKGFDSPKHPPLAITGIEISPRSSPLPLESPTLEDPGFRNSLRDKLIRIKNEISSFSVVSLVLFPGINASMLQGIFTSTTPPIKGMVLEAFGEGDVPASKEFLNVIREAVHRGVVIIDNTQCLMGSVNIDAYEVAEGLKKAGVISGLDLTPEATLTKLIYLISQKLDPEEVKRRMQTPIRGDLTPPDGE